MKTRILSLTVLLCAVLARSVSAAAPAADNILDFDAKNNDLREGRWAYGWFNGGSINDPKKTLRLFTQAYPETRLDRPHWAVDSKKREFCWVIASDGRAWVDRADVAWIYTVPADLAGEVRITGAASGGGASKRLRIFVAKDEFFTGVNRETWTPLFEQTAGEIAIDLGVRVDRGALLLFVQNDTGTPPNYRSPQKLQVRIAKEH